MHYEQKEVPMEERYPRETCPPDPWKHRGTQMRCHTCMWFVMKAVDPGPRVTLPEPIGRCRRRAPTHDGYPVVFQTDWCGDHKLDQNKL